MERIDTHCHIVPRVWRMWCEQYGWETPDGMPSIPVRFLITPINRTRHVSSELEQQAELLKTQTWTPEEQIALMDKVGISRSILSITSPGTHLDRLDDSISRQITRETNNEVSRICDRYPDRFSFFASLPLPDVEGSLAEIDHALDKLGACGFALMTNAHGHYLGDARFDSVLAKLNDRNAVIFVHPTQCHTKDHPDGEKPLNQYPAPMMEYFFDTSRAVINLLLSGTVAKFPNLTFLVSHCGATLPPLIERFSTFSSLVLEPGNELSSSDVKKLFKSRFYFDLAGFPFPDLIHGYLRVSDASRLLYGSDYPYTPAAKVEHLGETMDKGLRDLFDDGVVADIYYGNAKRLLGI